MNEMDEETKRARMLGPKTGANWVAFPDYCWTVCWRSTWLRKHFCVIMLIYISTEVDDSDIETSLDFTLTLNEIQILLLTKTRLGVDGCLSSERRKPIACQLLYVLSGLNFVSKGDPKNCWIMSLSGNNKSAVSFDKREG